MSTLITTHSGKTFLLDHPLPEDILLEDIAWSLSRTSRFNGHLSGEWSVLQHSALVADLLYHEYPSDDELFLAGLLHDAKEAYMGDISTPVKRALTGAGQWAIANLERILDDAISESLSLPLSFPDIFADERVKAADHLALKIEAWFLLPDYGVTGGINDPDWAPSPAQKALFLEHDSHPPKEFRDRFCRFVPTLTKAVTRDP